MSKAEAERIMAAEERRKEKAAKATARWRKAHPAAAKEADQKQYQRKRDRVAEAKRLLAR